MLSISYHKPTGLPYDDPVRRGPQPAIFASYRIRTSDEAGLAAHLTAPPRQR
jgi:hypothetical protein